MLEVAPHSYPSYGEQLKKSGMTSNAERESAAQTCRSMPNNCLGHYSTLNHSL
jgi:hypothetical protein